MNYVKLHVDALEAYKRLNDAEFGRGIRALLKYVGSGEEAENLGREGLMYDALCAQVKRDRQGYDKYIAAQTENGKKGGRPRKEQKPKETQENPRVFEKPKKTRKSLRNNMYNMYYHPLSPSQGDDDDDLLRTQEEHNEVLDAAGKAGFPTSDAMMSRLVDLYAEHGKDKLLAAIDCCVEHNAVNLAYLRAVLKDKPKPEEEPYDWMAELRSRGIGV